MILKYVSYSLVHLFWTNRVKTHFILLFFLLSIIVAFLQDTSRTEESRSYVTSVLIYVTKSTNIQWHP